MLKTYHQLEEKGNLTKIDKNELINIQNAKYLTNSAIVDSQNYNQ